MGSRDREHLKARIPIAVVDRNTGGSIAAMPSVFTFQLASTLSDDLILANGYSRRTDIAKDIRILIKGASGSIASVAVQLAKFDGAVVTATCNTAAVERNEAATATSHHAT